MHVAPFHQYLPISDEIFHDGFYITSFGAGTITPGDPYPVTLHPSLYQFSWREGRVLPDFSVILISSGSGIFQRHRRGPELAEAGMVILLFPGIWHRYRPDPKRGWTERWFQFNGELAHRLWERGLLAPENSVFRPPNVSGLEQRFDALFERIKQNATAPSLAISLEALGLIAQLIAVPLNSAKISTPSLVDRALDYIWRHNHTTISVDEVAREVGVNRRTLERHFANRGASVLDQIAQCRLNRAERLLRETSLSVKAIVNLAGFGTAETLRRTFVRHTGKNPTQYRKNFAKQAPIARRSGRRAITFD